MSTDSPLRSVHTKLGATLAPCFEVLLPHRFSSFEAEYRAARESVALFDTNYLSFFWLDGPDRVRFLNAVCTHNVKDLADSRGSLGLLLNPQGHILAELGCLAIADRLLLITHALSAQRTFDWLEKYLIMDDATLADASASLACVAVEGPLAAALLHDSSGLPLDTMPLLAHREALLGAVPCRVVRSSHFGLPGALMIVDRDKVSALWQLLLDAVRDRGGAPIGHAAINALRLEAGIPWFSYDFDDKVIPHEAGLEFTHISYTKGCYTGQEIVERVRSRGHVNRRRTALSFTAGVPPLPGSLLYADPAVEAPSADSQTAPSDGPPSTGKEIGHVTSAAFSPPLDRPIGFAYLRREFTAPGSVVHTPNGPAEVISLPLVRSP